MFGCSYGKERRKVKERKKGKGLFDGMILTHIFIF